MPLPSEISYWEACASKCVDLQGGTILDNIWKRPHQIKRLLKHDFHDKKVLEIGVGNGIVSGILRFLTGGNWDWTGTELSRGFAESAHNMFHLQNMHQADVREIPGEGYERIIAFDSLEHVRPEHREEGYAKIFNVAASGCLLFLHFSWSESHHDKEFDHPFSLTDIMGLEKAGFTLMEYERYVCAHPKGDLEYAFVVMKK